MTRMDSQSARAGLLRYRPPTAKGEKEEAHQTQAVGVHIGRSDRQSECARGWLGLGRPVALRSHSVHNAIVSGLLRFALSTLSRT